MQLEREIETFERELPRLMKDEGKFVLIHGTEVAGVYDNEEEAVEAGDEGFGLDAFLVRRIGPPEPPRLVPWVVVPPSWPS